MKKIFPTAFLILGFCTISCGSSPMITLFELVSNPITAKPLIEFNLEAEDEASITGWLINLSSDKPSSSDSGWTTTKPSTFILTGDRGEKTVYAWAKNGGSISSSASLMLNWVAEGTEDTIYWDKKIDGTGNNDAAYAIAIDADDNVYIVGKGTNLINGSSDSDWWIKKFDKNGNEDADNWNKQYDGNGGDDDALAITIDSAGNIYVAGYGQNIAGGSTGYDWWIKKFDSDGNEDILNWDKKDDFTNTDIAKSIYTDSSLRYPPSQHC
jgi:hypothetical protein